MTGKRKRKPASGWKVKVVSKESHVTRHVAEEAPNKSSEVNAFRNGESGGNLNVPPSLAVGNMDLISVSEDPQGSMKETRTKAPNKILKKSTLCQRLMAKAKLEILALKEKQELQRELERVEKGKAELNRKLELLDAKTVIENRNRLNAGASF